LTENGGNRTVNKPASRPPIAISILSDIFFRATFCRRSTVCGNAIAFKESYPLCQAGRCSNKRPLQPKLTLSTGGPAKVRNRRISLKKSAAESGGRFDRVRAREADSPTPELVLALE
jgi:hypothetical protein